MEDMAANTRRALYRPVLRESVVAVDRDSGAYLLMMMPAAIPPIVFPMTAGKRWAPAIVLETRCVT